MARFLPMVQGVVSFLRSSGPKRAARYCLVRWKLNGYISMTDNAFSGVKPSLAASRRDQWNRGTIRCKFWVIRHLSTLVLRFVSLPDSGRMQPTRPHTVAAQALFADRSPIIIHPPISGSSPYLRASAPTSFNQCLPDRWTSTQAFFAEITGRLLCTTASNAGFYEFSRSGQEYTVIESLWFPVLRPHFCMVLFQPRLF